MVGMKKEAWGEPLLGLAQVTIPCKAQYRGAGHPGDPEAELGGFRVRGGMISGRQPSDVRFFLFGEVSEHICASGGV